MNIVLKILFIFLSAGAMIMLFYAVYREAAINKIVKRGMDMGYEMGSGTRWFGDRIGKWKIGTIFSSGSPIIIGLVLLGYVLISVLVLFSFKELIEIVIFAYVLYHILIRSAKQNAQALSFFLALSGLAGTIMGLFVY